MKKFLYLIVLLTALTSCEEDIQFNTPAVQALKNNELWRATQFSATKASNNALTIQATNGFETLVLKTRNSAAGEYNLGVNETDKASYVITVDSSQSYQTGAGIGQGSITISDNPTETNIDAGFVTGTFHFEAISDDGSAVYFQEGVFYKVPITGVQ